MGYSTDFHGEFTLTPALNEAQIAYLKKFNETRRMKRNASVTGTRPDPIRKAVGLPVGMEGGFFVGAEGFKGQEHGADDVIDGNRPPAGQPGLWCQWTPTEDGKALVWDEGEKFYEYEAWLIYLIEKFLKPWGITVNGTVEWQGEDSDDFGKLVVEDGVVSAKIGRKVYD